MSRATAVRGSGSRVAAVSGSEPAADDPDAEGEAPHPRYSDDDMTEPHSRTPDYGDEYVLAYEAVDGAVHLHERDPEAGDLRACHLILGPEQAEHALDALAAAKERAAEQAAAGDG